MVYIDLEGLLQKGIYNLIHQQLAKGRQGHVHNSKTMPLIFF